MVMQILGHVTNVRRSSKGLNLLKLVPERDIAIIHAHSNAIEKGTSTITSHHTLGIVETCVNLSIIVKPPHLIVWHSLKVAESKTKVGIICCSLRCSETLAAHIVSDMRNDETITNFCCHFTILHRFRKNRCRVLARYAERGSLGDSNESGGKSQGGHKGDTCRHFGSTSAYRMKL